VSINSMDFHRGFGSPLADESRLPLIFLLMHDAGDEMGRLARQFRLLKGQK
jgi:hypothetical protein